MIFNNKQLHIKSKLTKRMDKKHTTKFINKLQTNKK